MIVAFMIATAISLFAVPEVALAVECQFPNLPVADFRSVDWKLRPGAYRDGGLAEPDEFVLLDGTPLLEKGIVMRGGGKAWVYTATSKTSTPLEFWFAEKMAYVSVRIDSDPDGAFIKAECH